MRKIMLMTSIACLLMNSVCVYADDDKNNCSRVNWVSKDLNQRISIQNGNGIALIVNINVNNGGAGVNVANCGTTYHIDPGSSAICTTSDPSSIINFVNDSSDKPASGTYSINKQY